MIDVFDGTGFVAGDYALAVLLTLSAVLTYARIAFETSSLRFPIPRMVIGVGFTLLSVRFWYTLSHVGDIIVAPISMIAIAMVTTGYSAIQLFGIRRALRTARVPIFCLQDPTQPCQREDRIKEALLQESKK